MLAELVRGLLLVSITSVCFAAHATAQDQAEQEEFVFDQADIQKRAKLAKVLLSGKDLVTMLIPESFLGDIIQGRVLLINDSDQPASISDVQTSCGCASMIPVARQIDPGKSSLLLISFTPKAEGENRIQAKFTFGGRKFLLRGINQTKPRFTPIKSKLSLVEGVPIEIEIRKNVATKVDDIALFPSAFQLESLRDTDKSFFLTLSRDSGQLPAQLQVTPISGDTAFAAVDFDVFYPGVVEVLPRRLIVTGESMRFYLRGDIAGMADAKQLTLSSQDQAYDLECSIKERDAVLIVSLKNPLAPGDHQATIKINDVSFPLPVTVR